MHNQLLMVCLIFSGFSGLAYELLWVRLLSFSFGSSTAALSTVLAVFFGGLTLGALLSGKLLNKIDRPVLSYAGIETLTGITGLLLYPILLYLPDIFAAIATGDDGRDLIIRILVSILVLLIPTILMGATLPVVCKGVIFDNSKINRGTSLIYGINTLGAFAGAYLITYHFLPSFGIRNSIFIAVCSNIIAAAIAVFSHIRQGKKTRQTTKEKTERQNSFTKPQLPTSRSITLFYLALMSGFSYILLEVVWSRVFSILLGGTIYGIGAVLICFLIGIGLGSLFSEKFSKRIGAPLGFIILQIISILSLFLFIKTILPASYILGALNIVGNSVKLGQHAQLGVVFIMIGLPTLCSGASFPLLVEMATDKARDTGKNLAVLYAFNTLGCIASSLIVGFYLLPNFGSGASFYLSAFLLITMIVSAGLLLVPAEQRKWALLLIACSLLLISRFPRYSPQLITAPVKSHLMSYQAFKQTTYNFLKHQPFFHEGIAANVLVSENSRYGKGLSLNGLGQGGLSLLPPKHVLESTLMAAIPNIFINPENALVVGLGAGVTVDVFSRQPELKIDVVELEPSVVKAVDVLFNGKTPVLKPNVALKIGDARNFLLINRKNKNNRYDIITSMPAHPWVASSLFTREFFSIARDNLTDRGVFCCWFGPGSGVPWDKVSKVLMRTFASVFHNYVVFAIPETGSFYLVGSKNKLSINLDNFHLFNTLDVYKEQSLLNNPEKLLARIYASGEENTPSPDSDELFNTDDNAYVEVQVPLMMYGKAKKIKGSFLPREFIPMDMLAGTGLSKRLFLNIQEEILRTPTGSLPLIPLNMNISPKCVEKLLADKSGAKMLSSQAITYLRGRLAITKNKHDRAEKFLKLAAAGKNTGIAFRAKKWLLFSTAQEKRDYLSYLENAPLSDDIFAEFLNKNMQKAIKSIPQEISTGDKTPMVWMAHMATRQEYRKLSRNEKNYFLTQVVPDLKKTVYVNLALLGEKFARKYHFPLLSSVLEQRKIMLLNKKANQLYLAGMQLAQKKKYREAKSRFLESINLLPTNLYAIERYFYILLRLKQEREIPREIERLSSTNRKEMLTALADKVMNDFIKINKKTR